VAETRKYSASAAAPCRRGCWSFGKHARDVLGVALLGHGLEVVARLKNEMSKSLVALADLQAERVDDVVF